MSCTSTGAVTSPRPGRRRMRPVSVSKSASSHAGIAETVSVAVRASGSTGLLVR